MVAERKKKKDKDCPYEEDNKKCPNYTAPEYHNATYCIYMLWSGECLNHNRQTKEVTKNYKTKKKTRV